MSILFDPLLWEDQFGDTPPFQWEKVEENSHFWFEQNTDQAPLNAYIPYIGAADLPSELIFDWEITTAATNGGTFTFFYKIGTDPVESVALGSALGTGRIIVNPDPALAFEWGVGTNATGAGFVAVSGDESAISFNCECEETHGNRTLLNLRTEMARRLGYSAQAANLPPGMADLLNAFLQDAQRQLYRRYSALRTERFYRWTMTPGVRYYDLAANDDICSKRLDPYKVTWVGIEDLNKVWYPMSQGITPELYTRHQLTPGWPTRYEIRQCIEVFPAPQAAYTLRIKGHFGLDAFSADTDKTTIDSDLVFLLALANAKAHYNQPDARNIFSQVEGHMGALVAGSHQTARYIPDSKTNLYETPPKMVTFDR